MKQDGNLNASEIQKRLREGQHGKKFALISLKSQTKVRLSSIL